MPQDTLVHPRPDTLFSAELSAPSPAGVPGEEASGIRPAGSAAQVYGESAVLNAELQVGVPIIAVERPVRDNLLILNGLTVLLFLFFCYILYSYRSSVLSVLKASALPNHFQSVMGEQSVSFRVFLSLSNLLGFLCLVAICVKTYMVFPEGGPTTALVPGEYVFFAVVLAFGAILAYRWIVHMAISKITMRADLIADIVFFNKIIFSVFAFVLTPVILLAGFSDVQNEKTALTAGGIVLVITIIYYVFKSCGFFLERKISILQWILYLCAVEIWPVSFFLLMILRDSR